MFHRPTCPDLGSFGFPRTRSRKRFGKFCTGTESEPAASEWDPGLSRQRIQLRAYLESSQAATQLSHPTIPRATAKRREAGLPFIPVFARIGWSRDNTENRRVSRRWCQRQSERERTWVWRK